MVPVVFGLVEKLLTKHVLGLQQIGATLGKRRLTVFAHATPPHPHHVLVVRLAVTTLDQLYEIVLVVIVVDICLTQRKRKY